ncbi:MAG: MoaD/ThiS family protein [Patescibacteria group bacterium]
MNVTVRLPHILRSAMGGQEVVALMLPESATFGQMLDFLCAPHNGVRQRLIKDDGQPNRFVLFFIDEVDIRHLQNLASPLHEGADVSIVPAIAGG